jgi:hypothetical protein
MPTLPLFGAGAAGEICSIGTAAWASSLEHYELPATRQGLMRSASMMHLCLASY